MRAIGLLIGAGSVAVSIFACSPGQGTGGGPNVTSSENGSSGSSGGATSSSAAPGSSGDIVSGSSSGVSNGSSSSNSSGGSTMASDTGAPLVNAGVPITVGTIAKLLDGAGVKSFQDRPDKTSSTFDGDIQSLVDGVAKLGIDSVVVFDLTREDFKIPVVKVIAPGLEGYLWHETYRPGERAKSRMEGQS